MAAYPSFDLLATSAESAADDLMLDRASNGSVRGRALWTGVKRTYTVHHLVDATDRGTLDTFYDTNRTLEVSFTWTPTGDVVTCLFGGAPKYAQVVPGWWRAEVVLVEA